MKACNLIGINIVAGNSADVVVLTGDITGTIQTNWNKKIPVSLKIKGHIRRTCH